MIHQIGLEVIRDGAFVARSVPCLKTGDTLRDKRNVPNNIQIFS